MASTNNWVQKKDGVPFSQEVEFAEVGVDEVARVIHCSHQLNALQVQLARCTSVNTHVFELWRSTKPATTHHVHTACGKKVYPKNFWGNISPTTENF